MKFFAGTLAVAITLAASAKAQATKVVLVELFTSEGCSSCPPADALLARIAGTQVAGTLVVGLSEHVTYWNSLGWRDPWSQELFTARQNGYGDRFGLQSVYTPQIVVNGAREVLGSDASAVARAIAETSSSAGALSIGLIVEDGNALRVSYTFKDDSPGAELFAVVAEDTASSQVLRGENSGRKLTHVAVARNLVDLGHASGGTVSVAVPKDMHGARHLVLFVQERRQGKVLAVDSRAFASTRITSNVGQ